jgi:tripartite ATP-independent transporter DctM subunit
VVLFRFPGLLAALVVGALLLSLAAAASPLFLAATSSGQVRSEIGLGVVTRYGAGISYVTKDQRLNLFVPGVGHVRSRQEELFTERVAQSPYLEAPIRSVLGPIVTLIPAKGRPRGGPRLGRLFAGEGAADHIEIVDGQEGPGVWLPNHVAAMGVGPGDRVVMTFERGEPVTVAVDGVYKALCAQPPQGFWRAWTRYIYALRPLECPDPPQFVIADLEDAVRLTSRLGSDSATFGWGAPVAAGRELTLQQARDLQAFIHDFQADMSDRSGEMYEIFRCCGRQWSFGIRSSNAEYTSQITRVVSEVDKRMTAIEGPVQLLLGAGLLVAAAVVAGASIKGPIGPISVMFIVYGVVVSGVASASISKLLLSGVMAELLLFLFQAATVYVVVRRMDFLAKRRFAGWTTVGRTGLAALPVLAIPFIILGGIFTGVFTPSESGAIAVVAALVLGMVWYGSLAPRQLPGVLVLAGLEAGIVMLLLGDSSILAKALFNNGFGTDVENWLTGLTDNKYVFLLLVNLILLAVGIFVEPLPALYILAPVLAPVAVMDYGIDPVHFGLIMVFNLVLALIHPPLGLVIFMVSSIAKVSVERLSLMILPWLAVSLVVLFLVTYLPSNVVLALSNLLE